MRLKLSDYWLVHPSKLKLNLYLTLSLILAIGGYIVVEISFYKSNYPVSLFEGQLAFDAAEIKSHYAVLKQQGTFGIFVKTQIIDFAWIIGLMLTLFFTHIAIARAHSADSKWQSLALYLAVFGPLIAASDAVENLFSFVMLANPSGFPDWIAPVYSSFAAIKWSWAVIGVSLIVIQLVALFIIRGAKVK